MIPEKLIPPKLKQFVFFSLIFFQFSFAAQSDVNWKLMLLKVVDIVKSSYVEKGIEEKALIYGGVKGMLAALDDPYTRFLEPKKYSEMKISLKGNFFGVGMYIGMKDHQLTVISPIDDTPAHRAGIQSFDKIMTIDKSSTKGLSLEEAVSKIRGPKGTKVVLGIKREGVEGILEIPIIRDKIRIKSIERVQMLNDRVGYFRLISFENKGAASQVRRAIRKLQKQGMERLIFDLRNNGGGLLMNAIDMASLFMNKGMVVYTIDREKYKVGIPAKRKYKIFDGPIVILINGASASASEILAGAVKDTHRGQLVGTRTFGKASVQNIVPLDDGSAILLTVAKYLTPKGNNIHKTGITPNVEVEVPTADIQALKKGKFVYSIEQDYQLQRAIEVVESL